MSRMWQGVRIYRNTALLIFNTVIAFAVLNLVLFATGTLAENSAKTWKGLIHQRDYLTAKYGEKMLSVYPGMNLTDIDDLLVETGRLHVRGFIRQLPVYKAISYFRNRNVVSDAVGDGEWKDVLYGKPKPEDYDLAISRVLERYTRNVAIVKASADAFRIRWLPFEMGT